VRVPQPTTSIPRPRRRPWAWATGPNATCLSPYARPDYVCSEVLDHTSVLRLVEEKWNLPALTARDAAANTPLDALDFASDPAFLKPPSLPEPSLEWGTW
jgi:phospholipase C